MAAGWDRPQEDEFALLTLGAPTPTSGWRFPTIRRRTASFSTCRAARPTDLRAVRAGDRAFREAADVCRRASACCSNRRRTRGAIEVLARLFPGAKFIHIVRHPYSLCSLRRCGCGNRSTRCRGCKCPAGKGMDEYVFDCLTRMYRGFEDQRQRLDPPSDLRPAVRRPGRRSGRRSRQDVRAAGPGRLSARCARRCRRLSAQQKDYKTEQAPDGGGAQGQDSPAVGGVL